ncbi:MAG: type II toxin-antitoxin system VapC family toxin [Betaproteobacteria bacterium]|nr:type II toxin-antitoxin system VapC family toxin [Betaproteobacteria bacterium]
MIVLDTHALVWWVTDARDLSARARRVIQTAVRRGPAVASAISIFEIATAVRRERLKLQVSLDQWLRDLRILPDLRLEPVTADIAQLAGTLEPALPGDPADRIIVATAIELKAKLVTADTRLQQSARVQTVW